MGGGLADICVLHHAHIVDEDHADVRDWRGYPIESVLGGEAVVFLVRDLQCDVRRAGLDLGHAGRGVGEELEDHRLELGCAAPVFVIALEPHERVRHVLVDHVGARADGGLFEALRADLGVVVLGQHISGQESHPLKNRGVKTQHIRLDPVAVHSEVPKRRPQELDRVACLFLACAFQRPYNVRRRHRIAVVPGRTLSHLHEDFRAVLVPAPLGQEPWAEGQIRVLVDILVIDRLVDRLDRGVHRRDTHGGVPRRQRHVIGYRQRRVVSKGDIRRQRRTSQKAQQLFHVFLPDVLYCLDRLAFA